MINPFHDRLLLDVKTVSKMYEAGLIVDVTWGGLLLGNFTMSDIGKKFCQFITIETSIGLSAKDNPEAILKEIL